MSILDPFLYLDWITPGRAIVHGIEDFIAGRRGYTFIIGDGGGGKTPGQLLRAMKRRGVQFRDPMMVKDTFGDGQWVFLVSVPALQARWAEWVLRDAGVQVDNPVPENYCPLPRRERRRKAPAPARGRSRRAPARRRQVGGPLGQLAAELRGDLQEAWQSLW